MRGWKKIFHANRNDKKAGVAILISIKIDFKTKAIWGGKVQEGGDIYIHIADSLHCTAETNTTL